MWVPAAWYRWQRLQVDLLQMEVIQEQVSKFLTEERVYM